jgi:hypothetical protein
MSSHWPASKQFVIFKHRVKHSKRKAGLCYVQEFEPDTGLDLLAMHLIKSGGSQFPSSSEGNEKEPFDVCISLHFCHLGILTDGSLKHSFEETTKPHLHGQKASFCLPQIIFEIVDIHVSLNYVCLAKLRTGLGLFGYTCSCSAITACREPRLSFRCRILHIWLSGYSASSLRSKKIKSLAMHSAWVVSRSRWSLARNVEMFGNTLLYTAHYASWCHKDK